MHSSGAWLSFALDHTSFVLRQAAGRGPGWLGSSVSASGVSLGERERRAFLLLALEASWPIGEAPISEDARRLLGRESPHLRGR